MQYITEEDVSKNLTMLETIKILEEAFNECGHGRAYYKPRERITYIGGVFNTMPGIIEKFHVAGLKTYIATRSGTRFVVVLFDTETSDLLALIEANKLGQIRTGALPAMVSKKLLRAKEQNLCIIGSGYQAETQLEGMISALNIGKISVYSRNFNHAKDFAKRMSEKFKIDIVPFGNAREALASSTVVNTVTDSNNPIFSRSDLGEEYHLNLCGANLPRRREVAEDAIADSEIIVVEDMDQALKESAEIKSYVKVYGKDKCINLKDFVLENYHKKKRSVFKSMGIGLEDVAAGYLVLKNMKLI